MGAAGLAFVLLRRGGSGELTGRVLAALNTICPWSLKTECGPLRGPVPEVRAAEAGFYRVVMGFLNVKGRGLEDPLSSLLGEHEKCLESPFPCPKSKLLGLLRMERVFWDERFGDRGTLPYNTPAA